MFLICFHTIDSEKSGKYPKLFCHLAVDRIEVLLLGYR